MECFTSDTSKILDEFRGAKYHEQSLALINETVEVFEEKLAPIPCTFVVKSFMKSKIPRM